MTGREFREVDHDLLADYVGGALDGTPEQTVVARLVAEDAAWADAHATLAPAMARVHDELTGWGAAAPEMPLAVLERLTAVLAGAGPATTASTDDAEAADRTDRPAGTGGPVPAQPGGRRTPGGRSGDGRADSSGPGRRRRWARLAGPVGLAAASLAAVGFGVAHLLDGAAARDSAASTMAGPAQDSAENAGRGFRFTGQTQRSGIDWSPATLNGASTAPLPRPVTPPGFQPGNGPGVTTQISPTAPTAAESKRLMAPGGLDRLTGRAALDACLADIAAEHNRGPVAVEVVDYATFNGLPAVVVRFTDPRGGRWAWASGAECGVPGSGADTRYQAQVG
ncbi:hypothetical protein GA0070216_111145 [Micromonospora matsumotoense]|uniref:Uncharacterized protein n=1 Tax=Micromonospora matsumotoense TaxID=121616 RepID=A0A1C4ZV40_9ACTN|nr:hypothetical protein [Micromonospora matsumotoense]SCF36805.1 hypothetical protein GA0070216_111145 [Micromonospora matsumotoense]